MSDPIRRSAFACSTAFLCLAIAANASAQDMPLTQVLIEGQPWEMVSEGHEFTDGCASDADGNFYFTDVKGGTTINKITPDGSVTAIADNLPRISGLQLGPDGKIYACQSGKAGRLLRVDLDSGNVEVLAENVQPNDLVVTSEGHVYFTETPKKQVSHISPDGRLSAASVSTANLGPLRPNGIALTPDQGTLAVSDHGGKHAWVWRIEPNGKLTSLQPYITLRTPAAGAASRGDGMTTDSRGRYYVTSAVGIQMFDPTGRMGGVIHAPSNKPVVSIEFAGEHLSYMYVAAGDKIYRRKTKTTGHVIR